MAFAITVHILEKVLAGQLQALLHGARQPRIADLDVVLHPALAAEVEGDGVAMHLGVPVAQRGKAIGLVALGILGVADPDQGRVEQADDRGHDLFPTEAAAGEILFHPLPQLGQGLPEGQHPLVLVGITDLAPARVVAILLATAGVASGSLQMAVGVRTDPDVGIGRRDGQLVDPLDFRLVADALASGGEVGPFATQLAPAQTRLAVVDVVEVGRQGGAEGGTGVVTLIGGDGQVGLGEALHYFGGFRARGHDCTDDFLVETVDSRKQDPVLMTALEPTDAQLREALLAKARARRPGTTFCPSEVARDLAADWRPLMEPLREVARELARAGQLRVTQKGEVLDTEATWRGPIRLSLA